MAQLWISFFLPEPPPGCPSYEEVFGLPIEINGSCLDTCPVNTSISYVCDESSSMSIGYAICTEDYSWSFLDTCKPASE